MRVLSPFGLPAMRRAKPIPLSPSSCIQSSHSQPRGCQFHVSLTASPTTHTHSHPPGCHLGLRSIVIQGHGQAASAAACWYCHHRCTTPSTGIVWSRPSSVFRIWLYSWHRPHPSSRSVVPYHLEDGHPGIPLRRLLLRWTHLSDVSHNLLLLPCLGHYSPKATLALCRTGTRSYGTFSSADTPPLGSVMSTPPKFISALLYPTCQL